MSMKKLLQQSAFFDAEWYLKANADVANAGMDAFEHYDRFGAFEGRDPSPWFRVERYRAAWPDVDWKHNNPLLHFLTEGILALPEDPRAMGICIREEAPRAGHAVPTPKSHRSICLVTHDLNIGGAPRVLIQIANWFQKHTDYQVKIVAMGGGPLAGELAAIAPLHTVGSVTLKGLDLDKVKNDLRTFLGEQPTLTFINSAAAGGFCLVNPFSGPVFGYSHEMHQVMEVYDTQTTAFIAGTDHIFAGGAGVYQSLIARGASEEGITVRPAFIDPAPQEELGRTKAELKGEFAFDSSMPLIVGCGTVNWRKQPDVFVRMAHDIIVKRGRSATFAWIGDGEDLPAMHALASRLGVADHIRFLGFRPDYRRIIAAADVFALTSSEDPFPLVCLHAAEFGIPTVAFREATGFSNFIEVEGEPDAGIVVPLAEEGAMFEAVDRLITSPARTKELGDVARRRFAERYTTDAACEQILFEMMARAGERPRVSVVVPNYNCAPYLDERLGSILNQTFKAVEVIVLDDASTDNSLEIIERYGRNRSNYRVVCSEQNGGSVFAAWAKGIELAQGDIIWLAEADDFANGEFLARALAAFDRPGMRMAYGRSVPVDVSGAVIGDWRSIYLDEINPGKWGRSHTTTAKDEVDSGLGVANTIPNASAVLVLRETAQRAIRVTEAFRLMGDWAFYLYAIHGGHVAYVCDAVNFHRRHAGSVTQKTQGSDRYFQEVSDIQQIVQHLYGPQVIRDAAFASRVDREAARYGRTTPLPEGRLPSALRNLPQGIMFGVGDLAPGGAQMFAIRFVNGLVERGAAATLLIAGEDDPSALTRKLLSPQAPIVTADELRRTGLSQFMGEGRLDAVITGHWWADRAIGQMIDQDSEPPPWMVIMHGCYENVLSHAEHFPDRFEHFARAQAHCETWVWTAEKNKQVFEQGFITPRATAHVVTGFSPPTAVNRNRRKYGFPEDAFIFALGSRAIPEKGWEVTYEAFQTLRRKWAGSKDLHLLLIGDGPSAERLSRAPKENVHFVAHTNAFKDLIAISDVGMLPSWFAGESLPLAVIEFLAQDKPVVVSDIGMCAWAISQENGLDGGIVVPRSPESGEVIAADLELAMESLLDPREYARRADGARGAFRKFDFDAMLDNYLRLLPTKSVH